MFLAGFRSGVELVSWKSTESCCVSLKLKKMVRVLHSYPTSKNADKSDANSSLAGNKQTQALLDRLKMGLSFGTWKFYVQDFIFTNHKPDSVPPSYKMCYRSGLETYSNFAITTVAFAATLMPFGLIYYLHQTNPKPITGEIIGFAVAGLVSSLALMNVALQIPLRIYYSPEYDDFLVFMPRLIPYTTRKLSVQPGQLTAPASTSEYFPWINLQHIHTKSKQRMIIDGHKFILPVYYNKLMGY